MAVIRLHPPHCESGSVRPGDVVFRHDPNAESRGHASIFVGELTAITGPTPVGLRLLGLPARASSEEPAKRKVLGECVTGDVGSWEADIVGQMLGVTQYAREQVARLAESCLYTASQLSPPSWEQSLEIDESSQTDGIPAFRKGTCTQFIQYLYFWSGIPLIDLSKTFKQREGDEWIDLGTMIAAFWSGIYPLAHECTEDLAQYPSCTNLFSRSKEK